MLDQKIYSLIAVYETGGFSSAAKKLAITQPAVSQHIKALEEELNVKIFTRFNGVITLTRQGEKILKCAKKMLGLEKLLTQELTDSKTMIDHITVGVTHTAESNAITEALAKYCAENTGIRMKIITSSADNLYNLLKLYEIDLAVVEGKILDSSFEYIPLDTDYLCLAVSPNHPFAKKELVTLEALKKEKMILRLPNSSTRMLFNAHLESKNMTIDEFNVILEVDNVATIKDLIRRDLGVSILPKSACLDEISKGKIVIVPIKNLSMTRKINIVYLKDFSSTEIPSAILKSYKEVTSKK